MNGKDESVLADNPLSSPAVLQPTGTFRSGASHERNEDWSKVTVVLYNRQIVFLDQLSTDVRRLNGVVLKRAEIIRALVDALNEVGPDLSETTSEDALKRYLVKRMRSSD